MQTVRAEPFTKEDLQELLPWFPDETSVVVWGGPRLKAPLDAAQLASLFDQQPQNQPRWVAWKVVSDQDTVGHFQLALDGRCQLARLGRVAIAPKHRGRGFAVPMVNLALATAFSNQALNRVELQVYTFNKAAIDVYGKCGLQHEGTCRQVIAVDGEFWDAAMMAILRSEWLQRQVTR
jgi:RimJ/RimL family protein N-acetyltransferase